jgi:hypothetical protein
VVPTGRSTPSSTISGFVWCSSSAPTKTSTRKPSGAGTRSKRAWATDALPGPHQGAPQPNLHRRGQRTTTTRMAGRSIVGDDAQATLLTVTRSG